MNIGRDPAYQGSYISGTVDEVRISQTARSGAWITTEYNNQNSPSTFASEGAQQSLGSGGNAVTIAPLFSPAPGTYSSTKTVTITSQTSGATIMYTLDGSLPTPTNGAVYSSPITVSVSETVNAVAFATGMTASQLTPATYVISGTVTPGPHLGIGYDTMGRPLTLTDLEINNALISNTTYGPSNELLSLAGVINETRTYNSMSQLTSIVNSNASGTSVNLTYTYSGTQNNGKITGMTDNISGEQVVYTYDMLSRLASATAGSAWGQSYGYDGFGNLQTQDVTVGSAPALSVVYNYQNNRQTTDCADLNGNINSAAGGCGTTSYNYDVSNRITSLASTSPSWEYTYAPHNRRVWRGVWTGSTQTTDEITFWSSGGMKLGTWALSWSGSQLIATMATSNYYFSGRLIKNTTGYLASDRIGSIGKFYPWGQEKPSATTNGTEKFTGYYRDPETGNDYAINRYHQPGMGRFLTVDPSRKSIASANPGSWNRYAYVLGDPVNGKDPKGLDLYNAQQCIQDPDSCLEQDSGGIGTSGDGGSYGGAGGRDVDGGGCYLALSALGLDVNECEPPPPPPPPPPPVPAPAVPTSIALVPGSDCYQTTYYQMSGGSQINAQRDDSLEVLDQYGNPIANDQIQEDLTPINNSPCPIGTAAQNGQCLGSFVTGQFNDTHISLNGATQAYYQGFNVTLNGVSYDNLPINVYNTTPTTVITIYQNPYAVWLNGNNGYTNGQLTLPRCSQ